MQVKVNATVVKWHWNGRSDAEGRMSHVCAAVCHRLQLSGIPPCWGLKWESWELLPHPLSLHLRCSLSLPLSSSGYLYPPVITLPHPLPLIIFCHIFAFPFHTPASSVSSASVINLFSSHLAAVEGLVSDQFTAVRLRPTNNRTCPCYLLSSACFALRGTQLCDC